MSVCLFPLTVETVFFFDKKPVNCKKTLFIAYQYLFIVTIYCLPIAKLSELVPLDVLSYGSNVCPSNSLSHLEASNLIGVG